jgi:DNA-binding winged helix-turn-helix (wHTH) protein/tetratricopeptide (TPR) repeat protein
LADLASRIAETVLANDVHTICIGSAVLDPATQRLQQNGREVRLDPKELAVLLELAAGAPGVVSREHLLARVWAGTSVVDNAVDQVIARLRRALGDNARQPNCIETLPKRGYRLMVLVARATAGDEVGRESGPPTVTFLPLATIGDESTLVEYARTASEEISNRLAESKSVRVIASGSAENGHTSPKFVGQGTLRRAGEKIHVAVQLVRSNGGDVLWSESFDEPRESATEARFPRAPFVARTIEAIVRSAHRADMLPTRSEVARRHYFHGLRELDALGSDAGDWLVAANYFERAVDHDPGLKGALVQLAYAYGMRLGNRIRADQAIARAHQVLHRLLRIDPNATLSVAFVNHSLDLDYASALANIEHAHEHGFANVARVEFHKAHVRYKQGWFDEALASADRGLNSGVEYWLRGRTLRIRIAHFMGKIEEAKRDLDELWARFGKSDRFSFPSVLASLGQPDLARAILRENDLAWREGRLHLCSYSFGGHYHLGEFDEAFVWMDRAIENREWWMLPFFRSTVFYADIRGDPRFQRAMRRLEEIEAMGSPTRSVATGARP